jgi:hypothetical protein
LRHGPHRKQVFNNSLFRVFHAAGTSIPSRYIGTIGEYTYRDTDLWEGFMKYVIDMGSGVMIYTPSFVETGSGINKLIRGYTYI